MAIQFHALKPDGSGVALIEFSTDQPQDLVETIHEPPAPTKVKLTTARCSNNNLLWSCAAHHLQGQLIGVFGLSTGVFQVDSVGFHAGGIQVINFTEVGDVD